MEMTDNKSSTEGKGQDMSNLPAEQQDDSDDEPIEDPFRHRLIMSRTQWAQTILLGIVLIPIRLMIITILMLLMWISSAIALRVVNKGNFCFGLSIINNYIHYI